MTALASLSRLSDLVQAGFTVTDVSSDDEHVLVELRDDDRRAQLRLGPQEARTLLEAHEPRASRTVTA